ncbi:MAG: thioredoxin family protein [Sulfurovum sp.]|nr:MAG: thioredoxin family protein [Sulfurovum sp.]
MNKILGLLLLFSSLLFSLEWEKDLDTAFEVAKKEQKVVMVLIEGEHCRWCTKMKQRTLSDEGVEKRLEKFVVVKVMREDAKAMSVLPQINGVPTIFFMTAQKEVLESIVGYFDVTDFTSYINDVEKNINIVEIK